jgi:hypothetical protein
MGLDKQDVGAVRRKTICMIILVSLHYILRAIFGPWIKVVHWDGVPIV